MDIVRPMRAAYPSPIARRPSRLDRKVKVGVGLGQVAGDAVGLFRSPGAAIIFMDGCFVAEDRIDDPPLRDLIAQKPERWFAARDDKKFVAQWELWGDTLTRPPRGYAANHPAIADIRRKDFVGLAPLSSREATGAGLVKLAGKRVWMAMAMAVPSRLWLGGIISPRRDSALITALVRRR